MTDGERRAIVAYFAGMPVRHIAAARTMTGMTRVYQVLRLYIEGFEPKRPRGCRPNKGVSHGTDR